MERTEVPLRFEGYGELLKGGSVPSGNKTPKESALRKGFEKEAGLSSWPWVDSVAAQDGPSALKAARLPME